MNCMYFDWILMVTQNHATYVNIFFINYNQLPTGNISWAFIGELIQIAFSFNKPIVINGSFSTAWFSYNQYVHVRVALSDWTRSERKNRGNQSADSHEQEIYWPYRHSQVSGRSDSRRPHDYSLDGIFYVVGCARAVRRIRSKYCFFAWLRHSIRQLNILHICPSHNRFLIIKILCLTWDAAERGVSYEIECSGSQKDFSFSIMEKSSVPESSRVQIKWFTTWWW